jgi:hypothetical protein
MIQLKRAKQRYAYFCQVMPTEIVQGMPNPAFALHGSGVQSASSNAA